MQKKKYPKFTDFRRSQIFYGVTEFGVGIYTSDEKFFWPERGISKRDYEKWAAKLEADGYEFPENYRNYYLPPDAPTYGENI